MPKKSRLDSKKTIIKLICLTDCRRRQGFAGPWKRFSLQAVRENEEINQSLAALKRADKNIDELLEDLNRTYHRMRQSGIDEELFDVISTFMPLLASFFIPETTLTLSKPDDILIYNLSGEIFH